MPTPYGHIWRTKLRPETLQRDCYECVRCCKPDRPMGLRSNLEVAHLDGDKWNNAPENLAILCPTCHKAQDYEPWSKKYRAWLVEERERRVAEKDASRPILAYLKEASAEIPFSTAAQ
jgi:5-methylcytosine-specific restriction endonuclease McrA